MLGFLAGFLGFNVVYHLFATLTVYGREIVSPLFPALLRESIWCLAFLIVWLLHLHQRKSYWNRRKRSWLTFGILLGWSVLISYFLRNKGMNDMIIGIKYGFWWMFLWLSGSSIGYLYREKLANLKLLSGLQRGLLLTVIIGFVWQGLKLWKPDFFASLGYELKLDDFQFGSKPPLYYLTGYEGILRRQGLFAGPNNYGYFLIAFFPLILLFSTPLGTMGKGRKVRRTSLITLPLVQQIPTLLLFLRIAAMLMTLSRAVIVGGVIVLLLCYRQQIKKLKKPVLGGILGGVVAIILCLSLFKRTSTVNHLTSKLGAIPQIIHQPLGYGLGTSGPAIHHNGTFLPENYYFQIALDGGTIGFLLRILFLFQMLGMGNALKKTLESKPLNAVQQAQYLLLQRLHIGFFALLSMGVVLHVFEDSMVNYLFFIIYGIVQGSLSHLLPKTLPFFFPTKRSLFSKYNSKEKA